eukprot:854472-Pyramimonas_sp.AAC.1
MDWMHCLAASGGVGQYVLNGVLGAMLSFGDGFELAALDQRAQHVKLPRSHTGLPKIFLVS